MINSTLHHPSHGGKYRIYLKLRNSELRNSPPGTHPRGTLLVNSNIDGSSSRPRFVFPFYLSTAINPKASDYLPYSVYLWSSTISLTVFVVTGFGLSTFTADTTESARFSLTVYKCLLLFSLTARRRLRKLTIYIYIYQPHENIHTINLHYLHLTHSVRRYW